MRTVLIATLAFLALPALSRAQSEEEQVRAAVDGLFDAMRAGDSTAFRAAFHPSARLATVVEQGERIELQVEESLDGFVQAVGTPHDQVWDERIDDVEISIDGRLAAVWAKYWFFIGDQFSHCGVDVFHLFKDADGSWRIFDLADTRRREGCGAAPESGSR
jgi:hypothetical protein